MFRDEYVAKYGGKAGLHKFLRDTGLFDRHLLPTVYVTHDQDAREGVVDVAFRDGNPKILRASHRSDLTGLVDVLETTPGIADMRTLVSRANEARTQARSAEVLGYACAEDPSYDGNVTLMVQPELLPMGKPGWDDGPQYRGSIVEHPHARGKFIVTILRKDTLVSNHETFFDSESSIREDPGIQGVGWSGRTKLYIPGLKVIDLYKRVCETLGYEDMSLQMEFGINKQFPELDEIIFHQARFFKPFAAPTFDVKPRDWANYVIGQTSPEGVVLDVIKTDNLRNIPSHDKPFLWIPEIVSQSDSPPLVPVPENMKAFLTMFSMNFHTDSLEHNIYRFMQKVDVSILTYRWTNESIDPLNVSRVKLISNGVDFSMTAV